MGMEALQMAIADYRKRNGLEGGDIELDDDHEGRIICRCFGITDTQIRKVAKINNLKTAQQITEYTTHATLLGIFRGKSIAAPHKSVHI